jgi:cell wall-associated NlpC family hydrolase
VFLVRNRLISALSGFALVASVAMVSASTPAAAEPEIDDVQQRVDRLFHEAEQASERLNDAKLELVELERDVTSLQADQQRQQARLETAREDLQHSIISQYEGRGLSALGQITVSDDPGAFVSQLSTMSAYNDLQNELFSSFATESKALNIREQATDQRAAEVTRLRDQLVTEKDTIETKLNEAESLLDRLKEEEREALLSRGSVRLPSGVPTSGRAAAAVGYAMAQVGDAYVYGAAGPSAFDCSGLTMMAWAQAGVGLPHSSSAQYGSGPHVAAGDLRPGDLVFYYSPISHVGMYIGNGLIVHAANPGAGVRVADLYSMPYVGAVRPG